MNGLEVAYRRVGEGPPLVFVHGAAEDGRVWQPQLAALADEFTVVAWDEPGAGRVGGDLNSITEGSQRWSERPRLRQSAGAANCVG